jgi:hypothetical protein
MTLNLFCDQCDMQQATFYVYPALILTYFAPHKCNALHNAPHKCNAIVHLFLPHVSISFVCFSFFLSIFLFLSQYRNLIIFIEVFLKCWMMLKWFEYAIHVHTYLPSGLTALGRNGIFSLFK